VWSRLASTYNRHRRFLTARAGSASLLDSARPHVFRPDDPRISATKGRPGEGRGREEGTRRKAPLSTCARPAGRPAGRGLRLEQIPPLTSFTGPDFPKGLLTLGPEHRWGR